MLPNIWATFEEKVDTKSLKKLPNLVGLSGAIICNRGAEICTIVVSVPSETSYLLPM